MTGEVATWRMVVAAAVVAGLAVSLGVVALPGEQNPAPDEIPGAGATTLSSIAPRSVTTVVSEVTVGDAVRVVVSEALTAWGQFAGSGDLADVEGFFDPHGPQWSVFEEEAGSVGAPFAVEFDEESLISDGGSAVLRAAVRLVADGGDRLVVEWEIELRPDQDGRWRIWSVRDLASG